MYKFLILDAYDRNGRQALASAGARAAGDLYATLVSKYRPNASLEIFHPADADAAIPDLSAYDAMFWTGSSLTIYDKIAEVGRQIELTKEAYRRGIPAFGSCWALQLAAIAAGGSCRKNPKGREFGLTRGLQLSEAGRAHRVFAGRDAPYCGFTSHFDEVESLPASARVLVTNAATHIQGAEIQHENGSFFALQYHPEFDYDEIAALSRFRGHGLIEEGFVEDAAGLEAYIAACQQLQKTPEDQGLRDQMGADDSVLDVASRHNELINWLDVHFPKA